MDKKEKVFEIVARIPKGKVTTYGQIARLVDSGPRAIGQYLHKNTDPKKYPCHRVVQSDGKLANGYAFGGEGVQKQLLEKEGVGFKKDRVDIDKVFWSGK